MSAGSPNGIFDAFSRSASLCLFYALAFGIRPRLAGALGKRKLLKPANQLGTNSCCLAFPRGSSLISWEDLMERRAFLQLLCVGMGMASAATPAKAFTLLAPLAAPGPAPGRAPKPSVATAEDIDRAQVEKV